MSSELDRAYAIPGAEVIHENFGDETVVANLDTGLFYSLEGSGPDIWTALTAGRTVRQIAAGCDGAARDEVAAFVRELVDGGLLVPAEAAPGLPPDAAGPLRAGRAPVLRRFDDLQGLLLVDPIHEASPAGWPFVQGAEALRD